jgi:hypothetical protein
LQQPEQTEHLLGVALDALRYHPQPTAD